MRKGKEILGEVQKVHLEKSSFLERKYFFGNNCGQVF